VSTCSPDFIRIANTLGGIDCAGAPAVVSVRSPFALTNGTLPVVEALMVIGAVASLGHALLWRRRRGDPTNLGLWFATVVYLLVLEPPLYFPDRFGLQDQVGLIFVHNVFSVQFLYNRLPLYIVAIYPALTYLCYVLVQRTGVLQRRNPLVGAACVAVVFHCFYEIFDNIGPQLRWWAWNPEAPTNTPWLGAVPVTSAVIFAGASPFGFALLTRLLIADRAARGPIPLPSLALRSVAVGVLTPVAMLIFSLPYGVLSHLPHRHPGLEATVLWLEIAVLAGVAVAALGPARRYQDGRPAPRSADAGPDHFLDRFAVSAGAVYLLVFVVLWAGALPAYLGARAGHTAAGAPTGSLGYAVACLIGCLAVLALGRRGRASVRPSQPSPLTKRVAVWAGYPRRAGRT
jgi:hypothetical protein